MFAQTAKLRILGETSAEIAGRPLGPETTHVFAAVLVLGLAPQHRVTRRRLATLLWPDATPTRQAERLRWLLSKLRGLGAPIAASTVDVSLADGATELDSTTELARLSGESADDRSRALDQIDAVLPDYAPDFSAPFLRWVEEQRETIADEILTRLVPLLGAARLRGDWAATDRVARAVRRVAPLHEEATLALAEALCARGDKAHGIALLDEYLDTVGDAQSDLRLPAELLRRRMRTATVGTTLTERDPAFVGRHQSLRRIHTALADARAGKGGALLFAGPAGIGKTRLLDEIASLATTVGQASVVRARWHVGDVARPLSSLTDVIPKLLELRGAAGCAPSTLEHLAQLSAMDTLAVPSALPASPYAIAGVSDWLQAAVLDLLAAVSEEQTVVIVLDDFQWSDSSVRWLWDAVIPFAQQHRLLWCFSARTASVDEAVQLFSARVRPSLSFEWLGGLEPDAARALVDDLTSHGARPVSGDVRNALLERGGGIPLVLQTLVRHWQTSGDLASVPSTLASLIDARLAQLTPAARRSLQVVGLLGAYSFLDRLERVLQMPRTEFVDALGQLESAGILTTDGLGATQGHGLWAEAAVAQLESSVARVLHRHIAEDLEWEMAKAPSMMLLWETARHWGLSGQSEQEMAAITSGAEHFVRNQLFSPAAEAYGRALEKSRDASEQLRLLRRRIDLLRFAGEMEAMLADIDRHERLAAQLDPFYERHNELEMLRYTAHAILPPLSDRFAREALACATDVKASTSHRFHALYNCARMALMGEHWEVVEDARRATSDLVPVAADDFRYRWLTEVDYHFVRGDLRQALASARAWYAEEVARGDPYMVSWSARKLGFAESLGGDHESGQRVLLESIRIARDAGLTMMLLSAHTQLIQTSAGYDPPEVARAFLARAKEDSRQVPKALPWNAAYSGYNLLSECIVLIDEGRPEEALALLPSDAAILQPEALSDAVGVRLAAQMMLPRRQQDEAEMHAFAQQLSSYFLQPTIGLGWHAAVYAEYLERYRGTEAADEYVRHYMRDLRREIQRLAPRLAPFVARAMASVPT